jgi:hypothetical protein
MNATSPAPELERLLAEKQRQIVAAHAAGKPRAELRQLEEEVGILQRFIEYAEKLAAEEQMKENLAKARKQRGQRNNMALMNESST